MSRVPLCSLPTRITCELTSLSSLVFIYGQLKQVSDAAYACGAPEMVSASQRRSKGLWRSQESVWSHRYDSRDVHVSWSK